MHDLRNWPGMPVLPELGVFPAKVAYLKFCISNRGITSELNCLVSVAAFAFTNGIRMEVSCEYCRTHFHNGLHEFFSSPVVDLPKKDGEPALIHAGRKIGREPFFRIVGTAIPFAYKRAVMHALLAYNEPTRSEMEHTITELHLPARYAAVHVRRGDKVLEKDRHVMQHAEASRHEAETYLRFIPADIDTIFVLTDDYKAVEEIKVAAAGKRVFTLSPTSFDGHSTHALVQSGRKLARAEVLLLLTESEVAARSSLFVGAMTSNVSRYVQLRHRDPTQCFSVDIPWHSG